MLGTGTKTNPFIIENLADLRVVDNDLDAYYELASDIDASDTATTPFTPIGIASPYFTGSFDAKGHKITDLNIDTDIAGMFYLISTGGVVRNLALTDVVIAGSVKAGGICWGNSGGTIQNAYCTGTITTPLGAGICLVNTGTIDKVYSTAVVAGANKSGLCYNNSGVFTNSYWDTEVSGCPTSDGGTGKTTAEMKLESTYTDWDFTNTWRIIGTTTYPFFIVSGVGGKENFQCVNDPIDAPQDVGPFSKSAGVYYALGAIWGGEVAEDVFLSGEVEGAAGRLTGTSALWKSKVNGLTGTASNFSSEVTATDLLQSPNTNEWFTARDRRILQVASIESDTGLTFSTYPSENPYSSTEFKLGNYWFCTPNTYALAVSEPNGDKVNLVSDGIPEFAVGAKLNGTWTFTAGSKTVTGSGGNALSVYPDTTFRYNYIAPVWTSMGQLRYGSYLRIDSVDGNNTITLHDEAGTSRVGTVNECLYCTLIYTDDLTDTDKATQRCAVTKKDSYAVKGTLNKQNIHRMSVRFRAELVHFQKAVGTSITGTAKPFILLGGTYVYGTERTITATEIDACYPLPNRMTTWNLPRVWEFDEILARPGGGLFTQDDFVDNKLEVGIILGNLSDLKNPCAIVCTQLCLVADVAATPASLMQVSTTGWEDYGFMVFQAPTVNGVESYYDELGLPVINGYNTLGWQSHKFPTSTGMFTARPRTIHRSGRDTTIYRNHRPHTLVRR